MNLMNSATPTGEISSLRGPEPQRIGGPFWLAAGALVLAMFAVSVVVGFVSAAHDNARIERLKSRGVPVVVTVTNCVGNIGGSGSNASGYTCHGSYRIDGDQYREVIGSKSTLSSVGSKVQGVADPARPSTVELASAVARSSTSTSVYVVPILLALLFVALTLLFLRRLRSSQSHPTPSFVENRRPPPLPD
jgi:hypothetical protein